MRMTVCRTAASFLLFFAIACGSPQSPPVSDRTEPEQPAPAAETRKPPFPNTGRVTIYVKGMTRALKLT